MSFKLDYFGYDRQTLVEAFSAIRSLDRWEEPTLNEPVPSGFSIDVLKASIKFFMKKHARIVHLSNGRKRIIVN